jgi:hypothetical protein
VPVHEVLLAEIYQVQSAIGQMTGKPETDPLHGSRGGALPTEPVIAESQRFYWPLLARASYYL